MAAKKSLSNTQIDKLGERLKIVEHSEDDLRMLEEYRSSFAAAYQLALETIRGVGEFPTGRVAKTTQSISAKLRRESLRLSQMQDIVGCRIIAPDIAVQNQLVVALKSNFPLHTLFDRREKSSYGYRAVHLVVQVLGFPVEIQVRTTLQQTWAELCEKAADLINPEIKYGGGPATWKRILEISSNAISGHEKHEIAYTDLELDASAAGGKIKQALLLKSSAIRAWIDSTAMGEEAFGMISSEEFSTLFDSYEIFHALVEEIVDDLDSKEELLSPRSLEQILGCLRRSREELMAELATTQATLDGFRPIEIDSACILENSRNKLSEKLSQIGDVLNSLEKRRMENSQ